MPGSPRRFAARRRTPTAARPNLANAQAILDAATPAVAPARAAFEALLSFSFVDSLFIVFLSPASVFSRYSGFFHMARLVAACFARFSSVHSPL